MTVLAGVAGAVAVAGWVSMVVVAVRGRLRWFLAGRRGRTPGAEIDAGVDRDEAFRRPR